MMSLKELAAWKAEIDLADPARLDELQRLFLDKYAETQKELWKWAQLMNRVRDRFLLKAMADRRPIEDGP